MTVPANTIVEATRVAVAITGPVFDAVPITITVLTEAEWNAREGYTPMPDLVGVTDAAEILGVSRQRVLQLIDEHRLTAEKVGKSMVLARSEVEAFHRRTA
ncbi:helix-turn-helix domain-containing protein [Leifsonia poae]|uniref:helix-turn-helix domain-containing protein n=1 Tax=Leifsonia poae TaxID=110933 RepID=UPI001CBDFF09|nr:helix-turn-helix domain-containing protein [Leifsonia poae]